jgi:hypothetical protein
VPDADFAADLESGVGNTALAVHWAHSVSSQYPDGQLFLNVRGHHPTLRPMSPTEAMGRLLGAIDVPWAPLTQDPEEGVGLWRSSLARRKLLIVLDDAIRADQVGPLLFRSGNGLISPSWNW